MVNSVCMDPLDRLLNYQPLCLPGNRRRVFGGRTGRKSDFLHAIREALSARDDPKIFNGSPSPDGGQRPEHHQRIDMPGR